MPPVAERSDEFRVEQEEYLEEARADLLANPDDAEALIWVGRRTAYLGRYAESIEEYSKGIELHPDDARFLRHRGHRYVTTRRLDDAERDLERAAEMVRGRPDEIEPDGLPNDRGVPTSTLQSNIWYHLGLAHYLKGDFDEALDAYLECMEVSKVNDDMYVATADWLYMTYRRLGREAEAAEVLGSIHEDMDILAKRAG